ncbi:MAG: hypothetical protein Kilf2KO_06760 [Rhodospirillales bacterium]
MAKAALSRRLGLLLLLTGLAGCAGQAPDGKALIGLSEPALQEALGPPQRIRKEAATEVWQYAGQACVLDVFLYQETGGRAVLHIEARDLQGRQADTGHCLGSLDDLPRTS